MFPVFGLAKMWTVFENFFDLEKFHAVFGNVRDVPFIPFT